MLGGRLEIEGRSGSLNKLERRIVKRLCDEGWSNQDIQALVNKERKATVNFGRISTVKKDGVQLVASDYELQEYFRFKESFDTRTGLNPFLDERIIKSREAMKVAVQTFNSPTLSFRSETFTMLSVVAWTYLALEYSERSGLPTQRRNGSAISLADFLKNESCPFSEGVKNNLSALIKLRDRTAHRVLGPFEESWTGIFQAACLNFEREIVRHFGDRVSLASELSFAIQFSGLSIGQAALMGNARLPDRVVSINKEIFQDLNDDQLNDQDFQFSVVYTTVASSPSKAAFQFISPESAEGVEISNVLVKVKPSDVTHPYRPKDVIRLVSERTGRDFNMHMHAEKWKALKVRPKVKSVKLEKTNEKYCHYNPTYNSYSYNEAWVELLCKELNETSESN